MKRLLYGVVCGLLILASAAAFVPADENQTMNPSVNQGAASGLLNTVSHVAGGVSEPATLSLLGVGLIGAAWVARKRRQKISQ